MNIADIPELPDPGDRSVFLDDAYWVPTACGDHNPDDSTGFDPDCFACLVTWGNTRDAIISYSRANP